MENPKNLFEPLLMECPTSTMPGMPLSLVGNGECVRVAEIHGCREMKQRLAALGMKPGEAIEVLQNTFTGPVTVCVKDSRIAIGRGMSHKIFVKPIR